MKLGNQLKYIDIETNDLVYKQLIVTNSFVFDQNENNFPYNFERFFENGSNLHVDFW